MDIREVENMHPAQWIRYGNLALNRRFERFALAGGIDDADAADLRDEILFGADLEWRRESRRATRAAKEKFERQKRR